jgi:Ca2+-binding EF-hand superfamily protein
VEISVALRDLAGRQTGRVVLETVLTEKTPEPEAKLLLPESFSVGIITITKVALRDVKNTEWFGEPDPYVILRLGKWAKRTTTSNNAGTAAVWSGLSLATEVDRAALGTESLSLEVYDDNCTRGDVLLGTAKMTLRKVCKRVGREVVLSGPLDVMGKVCGEVDVYATLTEGALESASDRIPEALITTEYGILTVKSATTTLLKAANMAGLSVTIQDHTFDSAVLEGKSSSPAFAFEGAEFPVTRDALLYKPLEMVLSQKRMMGRRPYGSGQSSLRPAGAAPGNDTTLTMDIVDSELNEIGKVSIVCGLRETAAPLTVVGQQASEAAQAIAAVSAPGTSLPSGPLLLDIMMAKVSGLSSESMLGGLGFGGKKTRILKLGFSLGHAWKATSQKKSAVAGGAVWNTPEVFAEVDASQAAVQPLTISLLELEVGGADPAIGIPALGHLQLPLVDALAKQGNFVEMKGQLQDAQGKTVCKVAVTARLVSKDSEEGSELMTMPPMFAGDEAAPASVPTAPDPAIDAFKSALQATQDELHVLKSTYQGKISALEKALKEQNKRGKIGSMSEVRLPPNVMEWRASHVQAWVTYKLDMPQYNGDFQEASVDGMVLLSCIDDDTLKTALHVDVDLHRTKILLGIAELKSKQKEIDVEEDRKRKQDHERKKAIEDAKEEERKVKEKKEKERRDKEARKAAKEELDAANKAAKKMAKKAKKGKKAAKAKAAMQENTAEPKKFAGEVREQNEVARVKMAREVRKFHKARRAAAAANSGNPTWAFEYTGAPRPRPEDDGVWGFGEAPSHKNAVSALLNSKEFRRGALGAKASRSAQMAVKTIPANASTTEVLAVVKGAMYQVSGWLVELENREADRLLVEGADLDALDDLDALMDTMEATRASAPPQPNSFKLSDIPTTTQPVDLGDELPSYSYELPAYSETEAEEDLPEYTTTLPAPAPESETPETTTLEIPTIATLPPERPCTLRTAELPESPAAKVRNILQKSHSHKSGVVRNRNDRVGAIFRAFVGLQNNGAAWLGSNNQLTRLKFQGGFETILRLKIHWQQFDALWTQMDSFKSGDLDVKEFKAFFGDLAQFEQNEGAATLSMHGSKETRRLTKYLYMMCDIFRQADFSIMEVFSSFDRNGSGGVSVSEFCSMLRLLMDGQVDKKEIYNALTLMDSDGDKSISLDEILTFVYRVWRTQVDDLAVRVAQLTEGVDDATIKKAVEERESIKGAIKKNFPRTWRDRLERQGSQLTGPFASLLSNMGIDHASAHNGTADSLGLTGADGAYYSMGTGTGMGMGTVTSSPIAQTSVPWKGLRYAKNGITDGDEPATSNKYANVTKTYALKSPTRAAPRREGKTLGLPPTSDISLTTKLKKEEIHALDPGSEGIPACLM